MFQSSVFTSEPSERAQRRKVITASMTSYACLRLMSKVAKFKTSETSSKEVHLFLLFLSLGV